MRVSVKGDKEILDTLEQLYGRSAMKRIVDFALKKGGQKVADIIARDLYATRGSGTGKSSRATNVSKPMTIGGVRTVKINWQGPDQRYRIIHLNEFGHFDKSGKWVNPTSKGAIDKAMQSGRNVYFQTIKEELKRRA